MKQLQKYVIALALPLLILLTGCRDAAAQELALVSNRQSAYKIIIPSRATAIEDKAAKELQKYIQQISGATLAIQKDNVPATSTEIAVGRTNRVSSINYSALGEDGLLIKTQDRRLILTGGSRKGVLYSVYTFLEDYLGCKKYTNDLMVIPKNASITLRAGINDQQLPAFKFRNTNFAVSDNPEYADWHKMNYFFEGRGSVAHTFQNLVPAEVYFKSHPEYFALVDGKRTPTQPCLSNPEVLKIAIANLRKQMQAKPGFKNWSVSPNDDGTYCHCNLCEPRHLKENGYMGTLLPFVNKVAASFPDATISTLAYKQSMAAPNTIKPARNVEIILCSIDVSRGVAIATATDEFAAKFRTAITRWKQLTPNLVIWDYVVNYSNTLSPYPNIASLKPNLQYFKANNASGIFEEGIAPQKGEFSELKSYMLVKLMWNPNADDKKIMTEFLQAYYGPAAPEISKYISLLQSEFNKSKVILYPFGSPVYYSADYLSDQNIQQYKSIFAKAGQLTASQPQYKNRVDKERLAVDFVELFLADSKIQRGLMKQAPGGNLKVKMKSFEDECRRLGISRLNSGGSSPSDFKTSSSIR